MSRSDKIIYKEGDILGYSIFVRDLGYTSTKIPVRIAEVKCGFCGNLFVARIPSLKLRQKSCGCVKYKGVIDAQTTHGMTGTAEHEIWKGMKRRCYNKKFKHYKNYGARGIKMSDEWLDFENFYRDMGDRPSPAHSIDRVDNDGNYCKENCRWATKKEQDRNTRRNKLVNFNGETKTLIEWVEKFNLDFTMVNMRLRHGWPVENAFFKPKGAKQSSNGNKQKLVLDTEMGIFYDSILQAANAKNMTDSMLRQMLSGGIKNKTSFIFA